MVTRLNRSLVLAAQWRSLLLIVALLLSIAGPSFTSTPDVAAAEAMDTVLAKINAYRAWLGVPPMSRNPALDAAASGHARYYELNYGDPSLAGMGLHVQTPGRPGFTGETMQDRTRAAGYSGSINENIGISGSMDSSVDWFIATINHRLPLIDPRYTDIGFGAVNNGSARIEVINVGAPRWSETSSPEWVAWPPAGTTGVGLNFWGEAPNPYPGASYPVGYPITLKYYGAGDVSYDSATLSSNGANVPVFFSTGSGWLSRKTLLLSAQSPLQAGTDYTVSVSGSANGAAFSQTWTFRTAQQSGEPLQHGGATFAREFPPGVGSADPAVQDIWWEADGPVATSRVERTWLWGPDTFASADEAYSESPDGARTVYYFDKSRMEITFPDGDRNSDWFVTNGLLVRDMILGAVQTGDQSFAPAQPASLVLAGDPLKDNPHAPTYASLNGLASLSADRRAEDRTGGNVQETLAQDGSIGNAPSMASYTTYGYYDDVIGHNVASVFWGWMNAQTWDWLYVLGHPLSEPYWVITRVNGVDTWVLVQAFERRVVTYTPANDTEWEIEMGNVGRHFYEWRNGVEPPGS